MLRSCICRAQFYRLWHEYYPHVSIPAVCKVAYIYRLIYDCMHAYLQENRFAKCDTCCILREEKSKTVDKNRRKALQDLLDQHNDLQRYAYYFHNLKVDV